MLVRCCPPYNCRHGRWTTVTAAKLASIWREDNVRSHQIGESATCKCYGVQRCYRCKGAVRTHVPQAQAPERVPAQLHRVPARVEVRHVQKPPTADRRRRAGPKALPVVAHGRSGAAKIDKIGRLDGSNHRHCRPERRRPAKLLPRPPLPSSCAVSATEYPLGRVSLRYQPRVRLALNETQFIPRPRRPRAGSNSRPSPLQYLHARGRRLDFPAASCHPTSAPSWR